MKKKIITIIQSIIYLLPFMYIGIYIGSKAGDLSPLYLILFLGISILLLFVTIIIHEAGHLLFGLWSGYQFSSFRVANLMWYKVGDKVKLTRFSIPGTGGQCIMLPPMEKETIPYFCYNAGGGILNVLVAGISWLVGVIWSDFTFYTNIFAMFNALTGIANLIPMNGLVPNDGYNIFALYRSPKARKAFALGLWITGKQLLGTRIKDIDDSYFMELSEEDYSNPITVNAAIHGISRLLDRGDYGLACHEIEKLLSKPAAKLPEIYRQLLTLELLYFDLIKSDFTRLEENYDKAIQSTVKAMVKSTPSASRFLYAYEKFYEQNLESSKKWQDTFEKVCQTYPYAGDTEMERELMELAINNIV
ncbi:MAG: M50 family metallopeptidase [Streptococcus hyovaginalis]|nr:M50 family metallopeptidase [Streptococcus hyovaginalis]